MKRLLFLTLLAQIFIVSACKNKLVDKEFIAKIRTIPTFEAQELDSTSIFTTSKIQAGTPTIFLYFDPECHTCQDETKMLTKYIADFKGTNIIMLSMSDVPRIRKFAKDYSLDYYNNIKVLKDHKYTFLNVFKLQEIPSAVIYNKEKQILKIFRYAPSRDEIMELLHL